MIILATVELLLNDSNQPGVRIAAQDEFLDMTPIERVGLLVAAVQLCGAAISAIAADNPDDQDEIRDILESVSIHPEDQALN
jgi:hypothetical protein